jgi:DNA-directed RNA polymerase specialized sigma24 family protein
MVFSCQPIFMGAVISDQDLTRNLPTSVLASRCKEETTRFFQKKPHDTRYCYELFRRAAVEADEVAWDRIYKQYRPLVISWIRRHSGFRHCDEELDYFINRAFEKIWGRLDRDSFSRFPDLKSILRYLQLCVHSVIVDHLRKNDSSRRQDDLENATNLKLDDETRLRVMERLERQEIWDEIVTRLNGEMEHTCIYATFILGLKPRQIVEQFDHLFADVETIYLTKQNVLSRMRRDAALLAKLRRYS